MGGRPIRSDRELRSLPRLFIPGVTADAEIELGRPELDRLRKVLRLSPGAEFAIFPNDGTLIHARLNPQTATPLSQIALPTESPIRVTVLQSLPKGEKLEEVIRSGTEIGVAEFVLFASERTVVRWDAAKIRERLPRLTAIARESSEVAFRSRIPVIRFVNSLADALREFPEAQVLSEAQGLPRPLARTGGDVAIAIGPEGGWAPREVELIGDRAVTLGVRVLRTEHAAAAAAAILLLDYTT